MALLKAIVQDNGVILNYHRIADIKNIVNDKTYLTVISYVNYDERIKEQNQPKYSPKKPNIYKIIETVNMDYNDTLTIENAYKYLKTLDKYKNAEDI